MNENILKRKAKQLEKQKEHLESLEDDFYGGDNRFERIYFFNGLLALVLFGICFLNGQSGGDHKVTAILFYIFAAQTGVGVLFTLGLLIKKHLHKKMFFTGLVLQSSSVFILLVLWTWTSIK